MRTGLIAKKMGMTRSLRGVVSMSRDGAQVDNLQVVGHAQERRMAIQLFSSAAVRLKPKNVSKAMRGHFAKAKLSRSVNWLNSGLVMTPRAMWGEIRGTFRCGQMSMSPVPRSVRVLRVL